MATPQQMRKLIQVFENTPTEQMNLVLGSGSLADVRDGNYASWSSKRRDAVRKELGLRQLNPPLLEILGTVVIPATTKQFIASEKFKLKKDGGICFFLNDNFESGFLGRTEDPKTETTLRYAKLTRDTLDWRIIEELDELGEMGGHHQSRGGVHNDGGAS